MRTAVVGAGPTGLYLSIALARRGHEVVVVDRDQGPGRDGTWSRRGVMQFHHPHAFRQQVCSALLAETPEVWSDLLSAGAEPVPIPGASNEVAALRCRRATFERVLRQAAVQEPGVTMVAGHAESVLEAKGRATGVRVDGKAVEADLVVDASGRAGRMTKGLRAAAAAEDCGISYVSQQHQLLPGAQPGPMNSPVGMVLSYPGYLVIVFPHDNQTFSTLVARATDDASLAALRGTSAFAAVLAAVPVLAAWTDPARSRPITPVMPGGRLYNSYRGQLGPQGRLSLPGVVFVGDAVCTTNPSAGRGVTTSLLQAQQLLLLSDEHQDDQESLALAFDAWCDVAIRPWFEDHVYTDGCLQRRWAGRDVDLSARLPSDLVVAAAMQEQSLMPAVGPYLGMSALPASLDVVQDDARALFATGWRPAVPEGPTRDELADLVNACAAAGTVAG
jgi:2-polyprenyl-6-methoxyphenol hydroxylase-like FAD-dependent oxidoreductase